MIIIITGASHTGKTNLAQKILEKYNFPYLSMDLLKMGLIRSKYTNLTPEKDEELQAYLWPITCEVIKTAIENQQNLVIEGCYIPSNWKQSFSNVYLKQINYYCLIMSDQYIKQNYSDIIKYASIIEKRMDDSYCTKEYLLNENARYFEMCKKYNYNFLLIDKHYNVDIDLIKY
ncbi:MAG: adenylate kinase [Clostridium sp.]|nr:adenylate kinase [Clostridium sp.]